METNTPHPHQLNFKSSFEQVKKGVTRQPITDGLGRVVGYIRKEVDPQKGVILEALDLGGKCFRHSDRYKDIADEFIAQKYFLIRMADMREVHQKSQAKDQTQDHSR